MAFSSSLFQLIRQKKISEIKTDFINNIKSENSAIGLFKKKKTLIFSTKYKSLEDRSDYKIIF